MLKKDSFKYRLLVSFCVLTFLSALIPFNQTYAQSLPAGQAGVLNLPQPGTMILTSPAYIPSLIKGITVHPTDPFLFDFIIHPGDDNLQGDDLKRESNKLIKYFMAALTVPEEEMWVNLSPYEKDRIIPHGFGDTAMGRDLLAQDYMLKQLTASLIYPENKLGSEFWERVHEKAKKRYGTMDVPINTFNKVWIIPEKAVIYESGTSAFIVESHLKVMLEEDYLSLESNVGNTKHGLGDVAKDDLTQISEVGTEVIRDIIIPELEREVNEGKTFANLRQISDAVILAAWYKQNVQGSVLDHIYINQQKTQGIDTEDKEINQKIYRQYLEAFNTGVFSYIKEEFDPKIQELIPRKYFSGGVEQKWQGKTHKSTDFAMLGEVLKRAFDVRMKFGRSSRGVPETTENMEYNRRVRRAIVKWSFFAAGLGLVGGLPLVVQELSSASSDESDAASSDEGVVSFDETDPYQRLLARAINIDPKQATPKQIRDIVADFLTIIDLRQAPVFYVTRNPYTWREKHLRAIDSQLPEIKYLSNFLRVNPRMLDAFIYYFEKSHELVSSGAMIARPDYEYYPDMVEALKIEQAFPERTLDEVIGPERAQMDETTAIQDFFQKEWRYFMREIRGGRSLDKDSELIKGLKKRAGEISGELSVIVEKAVTAQRESTENSEKSFLSAWRGFDKTYLRQKGFYGHLRRDLNYEYGIYKLEAIKGIPAEKKVKGRTVESLFGRRVSGRSKGIAHAAYGETVVFHDLDEVAALAHKIYETSHNGEDYEIEIGRYDIGVSGRMKTPPIVSKVFIEYFRKTYGELDKKGILLAVLRYIVEHEMAHKVFEFSLHDFTYSAGDLGISRLNNVQRKDVATEIFAYTVQMARSDQPGDVLIHLLNDYIDGRYRYSLRDVNNEHYAAKFLYSQLYNRFLGYFLTGFDSEAVSASRTPREEKIKKATQVVEAMVKIKPKELQDAAKDILENYFPGLPLDSAMVASLVADISFDKDSLESAPGGIDLNPNNININTRGEGSKIQFSPREQYLFQDNIDGFAPIIINISPITNVPLLLGESTKSSQHQLSSL